MAPRSAEQFEKMREKSINAILSSAMALFSERGFHGASIAEIAADAKISKGLAYNYFDSKEQILEAIVTKRLREVEKLLLQIPREGEPLRQVEALLRGLLASVVQDEKLYRLYFAVFLQPQVQQMLKAHRTRSAKVGAELQYRVVGLFARLGFSKPDLEAVYFFTTVHGLAVDYLIARDLYPLEQMITYALERYEVRSCAR